MIRRPPTRIELKNEDLQEFDYFQKMEKKRTPPSTQESQKLLRQERIGYVSGALSARAHFRRVETATAAAAAVAAAGSSSQSTATPTTASASTAAATAGSESVNQAVTGDGDSGDIDNESLAESLMTATGTPDLSTNMSMDISD